MRPVSPWPLAILPLLLLLPAASCHGDGSGGVFQTCGNGQVEGLEECDDQNTMPCDGCSEDCLDESGWVCGDGVLNQLCGEQCDDGNTTPGDGCDDGCMPEGPPLVLDGEYSVDIDVEHDTCNLGAGSGNSPMEVIEQDPRRVEVNIPVGGAGGECDVQSYTRDNDTLTHMRTSQGQIGSCIVQVDVSTLLTFFPGGTVTGFEVDTLSQTGGDCSSFTLPCEVRLGLAGSSCGGCFSCVVGPLGAGDRAYGSLAAGAGMRSGLVSD